MRVRTWIATTLTLATTAVAATTSTAPTTRAVVATSEPATTRAVLPEKIVERVVPGSEEMLSTDGTGKAETVKYSVILLRPPAEYVAWFKAKADCDAMASFRGNLEPVEKDRRSMVSVRSILAFEYGLENPYLAINIRRGWRVAILQTENETASHGRYHVAGVVRIDVRLNRRFEFPFDAMIEVAKQPADTHDFHGVDPTSATITWSRPEAWLRDR